MAEDVDCLSMWNGRLCIKGLFACKAQMTTAIPMTKPKKLGSCLNISYKMNVADGLQRYFKHTPTLTNDTESWYNNWYINCTSLTPVLGFSNFERLTAYLGKNNLMAVLKLGNEVLLLLPENDMACEIGVATDSHMHNPRIIHGLLLSRSSKKQIKPSPLSYKGPLDDLGHNVTSDHVSRTLPYSYQRTTPTSNNHSQQPKHTIDSGFVPTPPPSSLLTSSGLTDCWGVRDENGVRSRSPSLTSSSRSGLGSARKGQIGGKKSRDQSSEREMDGCKGADPVRKKHKSETTHLHKLTGSKHGREYERESSDQLRKRHKSSTISGMKECVVDLTKLNDFDSESPYPTCSNTERSATLNSRPHKEIHRCSGSESDHSLHGVRKIRKKSKIPKSGSKATETALDGNNMEKNREKSFSNIFDKFGSGLKQGTETKTVVDLTSQDHQSTPPIGNDFKENKNPTNKANRQKEVMLSISNLEENKSNSAFDVLQTKPPKVKDSPSGSHWKESTSLAEKSKSKDKVKKLKTEVLTKSKSSKASKHLSVANKQRNDAEKVLFNMLHGMTKGEVKQLGRIPKKNKGNPSTPSPLLDQPQLKPSPAISNTTNSTLPTPERSPFCDDTENRKTPMLSKPDQKDLLSKETPKSSHANKTKSKKKTNLLKTSSVHITNKNKSDNPENDNEDNILLTSERSEHIGLIDKFSNLNDVHNLVKETLSQNDNKSSSRSKKRSSNLDINTKDSGAVDSVFSWVMKTKVDDGMIPGLGNLEQVETYKPIKVKRFIAKSKAGLSISVCRVDAKAWKFGREEQPDPLLEALHGYAAVHKPMDEECKKMRNLILTVHDQKGQSEEKRKIFKTDTKVLVRLTGISKANAQISMKENETQPKGLSNIDSADTTTVKQDENMDKVTSKLLSIIHKEQSDIWKYNSLCKTIPSKPDTVLSIPAIPQLTPDSSMEEMELLSVPGSLSDSFLNPEAVLDKDNSLAKSNNNRDHSDDIETQIVSTSTASTDQEITREKTFTIDKETPNKIQNNDAEFDKKKDFSTEKNDANEKDSGKVSNLCSPNRESTNLKTELVTLAFKADTPPERVAIPSTTEPLGQKVIDFKIEVKNNQDKEFTSDVRRVKEKPKGDESESSRRRHTSGRDKELSSTKDKGTSGRDRESSRHERSSSRERTRHRSGSNRTSRDRPDDKSRKTETRDQSSSRDKRRPSGSQTLVKNNEEPSKTTDIGSRLEQLSKSNVPTSEKSSRSDKRQSRHHPYKKDNRSVGSYKPAWSFDLAYRDMNELLQNLTEHTYKGLCLKPAEVNTTKYSHGRRRKNEYKAEEVEDSYGNQGRFNSFRFRRADIPRTPRRSRSPSSDEERREHEVPDVNPDLEERGRQADMVEEIFMSASRDNEEEYSTEMAVYTKEQTEDEPSDTRVVIKGKEDISTSILAIPGGNKTTKYSGLELDDLDEASIELVCTGDSRRVTMDTVDIDEDKPEISISSKGDGPNLKQDKESLNVLEVEKDKNEKKEIKCDQDTVIENPKFSPIRMKEQKVSTDSKLALDLSSNKIDNNKKVLSAIHPKSSGLLSLQINYSDDEDIVTDRVSKDVSSVNLDKVCEIEKLTNDKKRGILSSESDVCLDWNDEEAALDNTVTKVFEESSDEYSDTGLSKMYILVDMVSESDAETNTGRQNVNNSESDTDTLHKPIPVGKENNKVQQEVDTAPENSDVKGSASLNNHCGEITSKFVPDLENESIESIENTPKLKEDHVENVMKPNSDSSEGNEEILSLKPTKENYLSGTEDKNEHSVKNKINKDSLNKDETLFVKSEQVDISKSNPINEAATMNDEYVQTPVENTSQYGAHYQTIDEVNESDISVCSNDNDSLNLSARSVIFHTVDEIREEDLTIPTSVETTIVEGDQTMSEICNTFVEMDSTGIAEIINTVPGNNTTVVSEIDSTVQNTSLDNKSTVTFSEMNSSSSELGNSVTEISVSEIANTDKETNQAKIVEEKKMLEEMVVSVGSIFDCQLRNWKDNCLNEESTTSVLKIEIPENSEADRNNEQDDNLSLTIEQLNNNQTSNIENIQTDSSAMGKSVASCENLCQPLLNINNNLESENNHHEINKLSLLIKNEPEESSAFEMKNETDNTAIAIVEQLTIKLNKELLNDTQGSGNDIKQEDTSAISADTEVIEYDIESTKHNNSDASDYDENTNITKCKEEIHENCEVHFKCGIDTNSPFVEVKLENLKTEEDQIVRENDMVVSEPNSEVSKPCDVNIECVKVETIENEENSCVKIEEIHQESQEKSCLTLDEMHKEMKDCRLLQDSQTKQDSNTCRIPTMEVDNYDLNNNSGQELATNVDTISTDDSMATMNVQITTDDTITVADVDGMIDVDIKTGQEDQVEPSSVEEKPSSDVYEKSNVIFSSPMQDTASLVNQVQDPEHNIGAKENLAECFETYLDIVGSDLKSIESDKIVVESDLNIMETKEVDQKVEILSINIDDKDKRGIKENNDKKYERVESVGDFNSSTKVEMVDNGGKSVLLLSELGQTCLSVESEQGIHFEKHLDHKFNSNFAEIIKETDLSDQDQTDYQTNLDIHEVDINKNSISEKQNLTLNQQDKDIEIEPTFRHDCDELSKEPNCQEDVVNDASQIMKEQNQIESTNEQQSFKNNSHSSMKMSTVSGASNSTTDSITVQEDTVPDQPVQISAGPVLYEIPEPTKTPDVSANCQDLLANNKDNLPDVTEEESPYLPSTTHDQSYQQYDQAATEYPYLNSSRFSPHGIDHSTYYSQVLTPPPMMFQPYPYTFQPRPMGYYPPILPNYYYPSQVLPRFYSPPMTRSRLYSSSFMDYVIHGRRDDNQNTGDSYDVNRSITPPMLYPNVYPTIDYTSGLQTSASSWMISGETITPFMQGNQMPDTFFMTGGMQTTPTRLPWVPSLVVKSPEVKTNTGKIQCRHNENVLEIPVHEIPLPVASEPGRLKTPASLKYMCAKFMNSQGNMEKCTKSAKASGHEVKEVGPKVFNPLKLNDMCQKVTARKVLTIVNLTKSEEIAQNKSASSKQIEEVPARVIGQGNTPLERRPFNILNKESDLKTNQNEPLIFNSNAHKKTEVSKKLPDTKSKLVQNSIGSILSRLKASSIGKRENKPMEKKPLSFGLEMLHFYNEISQDKTELEISPDKTELEISPDKTELEISPDKTELEISPDKTELEISTYETELASDKKCEDIEQDLKTENYPEVPSLETLCTMCLEHSKLASDSVNESPDHSSETSGLTISGDTTVKSTDIHVTLDEKCPEDDYSLEATRWKIIEDSANKSKDIYSSTDKKIAEMEQVTTDLEVSKDSNSKSDHVNRTTAESFALNDSIQTDIVENNEHLKIETGEENDTKDKLSEKSSSILSLKDLCQNKIDQCQNEETTVCHNDFDVCQMKMNELLTVDKIETHLEDSQATSKDVIDNFENHVQSIQGKAKSLAEIEYICKTSVEDLAWEFSLPDQNSELQAKVTDETNKTAKEQALLNKTNENISDTSFGTCTNSLAYLTAYDDSESDTSIESSGGKHVSQMDETIVANENLVEKTFNESKDEHSVALDEFNLSSIEIKTEPIEDTYEMTGNRNDTIADTCTEYNVKQEQVFMEGTTEEFVSEDHDLKMNENTLPEHFLKCKWTQGESEMNLKRESDNASENDPCDGIESDPESKSSSKNSLSSEREYLSEQDIDLKHRIARLSEYVKSKFRPNNKRDALNKTKKISTRETKGMIAHCDSLSKHSSDSSSNCEDELPDRSIKSEKETVGHGIQKSKHSVPYLSLDELKKKGIICFQKSNSNKVSHKKSKFEDAENETYRTKTIHFKKKLKTKPQISPMALTLVQNALKVNCNLVRGRNVFKTVRPSNYSRSSSASSTSSRSSSYSSRSTHSEWSVSRNSSNSRFSDHNQPWEKKSSSRSSSKYSSSDSSYSNIESRHSRSISRSQSPYSSAYSSSTLCSDSDINDKSSKEVVDIEARGRSKKRKAYDAPRHITPRPYCSSPVESQKDFDSKQERLDKDPRFPIHQSPHKSKFQPLKSKNFKEHFAKKQSKKQAEFQRYSDKNNNLRSNNSKPCSLAKQNKKSDSFQKYSDRIKKMVAARNSEPISSGCDNFKLGESASWKSKSNESAGFKRQKEDRKALDLRVGMRNISPVRDGGSMSSRNVQTHRKRHRTSGDYESSRLSDDYQKNFQRTGSSQDIYTTDRNSPQWSKKDNRSPIFSKQSRSQEMSDPDYPADNRSPRLLEKNYKSPVTDYAHRSPRLSGMSMSRKNSPLKRRERSLSTLDTQYRSNSPRQGLEKRVMIKTSTLCSLEQGRLQELVNALDQHTTQRCSWKMCILAGQPSILSQWANNSPTVGKMLTYKDLLETILDERYTNTIMSIPADECDDNVVTMEIYSTYLLASNTSIDKMFILTDMEDKDSFCATDVVLCTVEEFLEDHLSSM